LRRRGENWAAEVKLRASGSSGGFKCQGSGRGRDYERNFELWKPNTAADRTLELVKKLELKT